MNRRAFALSCCLVAAVAVVSAATIKNIKLADAYDESNRVVTPVYQNPGITIDFAVTGTVKPRTKFVRRAPGGGLFTPRGPEYDLDPGVNVGTLLTNALRSEAAAMGLIAAGTSERQWRVTGAIRDVYLESRQIYMGATLFYGYLDVELAVSGPGAESRTVTLRAHNYSGGYNAGLGRRDEAESAAAQVFVEGAQEILARLNRDFFKAPPSQSMSAALAGLQSGEVKDKLGDLRMVGLSGVPGAAPVLLGVLQGAADESTRAAIVDSLGMLGATEAVAILAARYPAEDEDVRWYTLKAMDYIGGPDAQRLVTTAGLKDDDGGPRRLAEKIATAHR